MAAISAVAPFSTRPRGLHRQGRQHQLHDGVAAPRQQVSTARRSERSPDPPVFSRCGSEAPETRSATTTGTLGERRARIDSSISAPVSPPGAPPRRPHACAAGARVDHALPLGSIHYATAAGDPSSALGSARSFTDSRLAIRSWPILWRASVVARGDDRRRAHRMGRPPTRVGELFSVNPYPWGFGTA